MSAVFDIAMGFDARYAPHAAAVIASIVRNARGARFRFIIVHDGVDLKRRAQVESVAPGDEFLWRQVRDEDLPAFHHGHLNRAILFRLGLETLAPADSKRVVYIDSDTVVWGDVRSLFGVDLDDCAIGAAVDRYVDAADFATRWGLPGAAPRYFNSGVLVIDLERVREQGLFSRAAAFVAEHGSKKLPYGDQDALNFVLWERWRQLDPDWNVQRFIPASEIATAGRSPQLVHFIGLDKPWLPNTWHPWAWTYWDNLKRTTFEEEVVRTNKMDFYQLMRLRMKWLLNRPPRERAR